MSDKPTAAPVSEQETCRLKLADAEMDMRRAIVALRLEVPDAVWQDVNRRFAAYRDAAWEAHNRGR